jgi:CAAX protease family protein
MVAFTLALYGRSIHHRRTLAAAVNAKGSTMKTTTAPPLGAAATDDRARDLPQYSLRQILGIWAAATVPMGILGWVVAPWMSHWTGGRDPFIDALLICFNLGLVWMLVLVLALVRREQKSWAWSAVRDALWLRAPRDPRTKRVGGRVWWWLLPFIVVSAGVNALPLDPTGPLPRDFPAAILTDRVKNYFNGNWGGFALLVAVTFLSPIVEELLFRGLLLPRMRAVFGRADVVASSAAYTLYHLHQPWSMPASFIDGVLNLAYPTRRFQSTWMGLIVHTAPSLLIAGTTLTLVL